MVTVRVWKESFPIQNEPPDLVGILTMIIVVFDLVRSDSTHGWKRDQPDAGFARQTLPNAGQNLSFKT